VQASAPPPALEARGNPMLSAASAHSTYRTSRTGSMMAKRNGSDWLLGSRSQLTCPWCGDPVTFACTAEDVDAKLWSAPVYECRTHGTWYLTQNGLRRQPPATRV